MSESIEVVRCLYCDKSCQIISENAGTPLEKYFMNCKTCGKKELTKLGLARLKARSK
jgi:hypothetical protein